MNFSKNTRGQGMSTNTIVLLILGLVLLVALIFGFATGWDAFKKIANPTNVDSIVEDCQTACSLSQKYSFCSSERTLRINEEDLEVKTSCYVLSGIPKFGAYVGGCSAIDCELTCDMIKFNDDPGTDVSGDYDISALVSDVACWVNN